MASGQDDLYVLFLRISGETSRPDGAERPVLSCSSYGEARRWQRLLQNANQQCVIRFQGDTGGGD